MSKIVLNRPQRMNSIGKNILAELGECIEHVSEKKYRSFSLQTNNFLQEL